MAINPLYIPLFNIEEVILDKDTGLPLAAGVVNFYSDAQRAQPKPVFRLTGTYPNYTFANMGAELTLGIAGDFVDGNGDPFVPYAYPYDADGEVDLYYVTVESSGGVAQFVREAVPYIPEATINPEDRTSNQNELSNPQFVEVNFPAGEVVLNVTGSNTVTKIAPDWDIITSGTGTLTVERLEPTASSTPTNPPYALRIEASSGFGATIQLRQRLTNTPSIYRAQYISGSLTARVISGGASSVSMVYAPSTGTSTTIIPSTAIDTDGAYHIIADNNLITNQVNTAASTGYVDILVTLPTARNLAITSLQIVGVATAVNIPYDEETVARQKDHLFHYYEDATVHQSKTDILTGWNFSLNPWQVFQPSGGNVVTNEYTADQTIIIQQEYVATAVGSNVTIARGSAADNYPFQITPNTSTNKIAVLQYIDPKTARPYWGKNLSVRVRAKASVIAPHTTTPKFKVRLIYKSGLPGTLSRTVPVSAWDAANDSIPTVSGDGWTYITAINDPTYTLTGSYQNFDFNQFTLPASDNDNMTLGIMFIMMNALDQTATADIIKIERISMVQNDFAIDCAPKTFDETLRDCQFFYEKSYSNGTAITTATTTGSLIVPQIGILSGGIDALNAETFTLNYKGIKRTTAPTITIYNPSTGTANSILGFLRENGVTRTSGNITFTTGFTETQKTEKSVNYFSATGAILSVANLSGQPPEALINFHYTVDARLGLVV